MSELDDDLFSSLVTPPRRYPPPGGDPVQRVIAAANRPRKVPPGPEVPEMTLYRYAHLKNVPSIPTQGRRLDSKRTLSESVSRHLSTLRAKTRRAIGSARDDAEGLTDLLAMIDGLTEEKCTRILAVLELQRSGFYRANAMCAMALNPAVEDRLIGLPRAP